MTIAGAVGLAAGLTAGSVALIGWALSSVVEGAASVIVDRDRGAGAGAIASFPRWPCSGASRYPAAADIETVPWSSALGPGACPWNSVRTPAATAPGSGLTR